MSQYIDINCDVSKLKRFVDINFENCVDKCKFNLDPNEYNNLMDIKKKIMDLFMKQIHMFNLRPNYSIINRINDICSELFGLLHSFENDICVCGSYVVVLDMQKVLIKKLNEYINTLI